MPCIICLIALTGLGLTALIDEAARNKKEIIEKLGELALESEVVSDTESVTKWQGIFDYTFEDGTTKEVNTAVYFYNEDDKVKLQILDHSISQAQAQEFQDFFCTQISGEIIDRNYPHSFDDDHHHDAVDISADTPDNETGSAQGLRKALKEKRTG